MLKNIFIVSFTILISSTDTAYGQSEECEEAMYETETYAVELESRAKKLRRCASSEDASDLEYRAKKLQSCAGWNDYTDDCSSEFRKVKREYSNLDVCYREYRKTKSAFSDYESAVSEISYSCE